MARFLTLSVAAFIAFLSFAAQADTVQSDPVTLKIWTIDNEPFEYHFVLAKKYEKQHPNVEIKVKSINFDNVVTKLARAVATGGGPDIAYLDNPNVALFASHGELANLTPYIKKSDVIDSGDWYPGPRKAVTWDGKIYGIMRGANTLALYYNADMFRAVGLDPDNPPETWKEFYKYAKKLTKPEKSIYGVAFSAAPSEEGTFQFLPWVQMAGGDWNHLVTPGAVRALKLWKKFIDEGIASPATLHRSQYAAMSTFIAGNAAMVITGPWALPRLSKKADFDWRVALLPLPSKNAERASALGEGANVILTNTEHPKAAFQFLEFAYKRMEKVWNKFGYLPISKEVEVRNPKYPDAFHVFRKAMEHARVRGPSPHWAKISKAIYTAVQQALTGKYDSKKALTLAQKKIESITGK